MIETYERISSSKFVIFNFHFTFVTTLKTYSVFTIRLVMCVQRWTVNLVFKRGGKQHHHLIDFRDSPFRMKMSVCRSVQHVGLD